MKLLPLFESFLVEGQIDSILKRRAVSEPFEVLDFDDYESRWKKRGAKALGSGSSAVVLQLRNGDVVKLFAPVNDPAMVRYLSFTVDNQKNPFVPKVRKILKTWAKEEERWMLSVVMEKLEPSSGTFADSIDLLLNSDHSLNNQWWQDLYDIIAKKTPRHQKSLEVLISFLKGHMKRYNQMQDFSSQNWMMRGNQPVLIDPFWPGMD